MLYADDLPEMRELLRVLLAREGHVVTTVEDGEFAWERLTADPAAFDLLVTDHHMPRLNGLELVERVRGSAFRGKVVVFSSELSPAVHAAYRAHAVDAILAKPIFPGTLRDLLRQLFQPTRSA